MLSTRLFVVKSKKPTYMVFMYHVYMIYYIVYCIHPYYWSPFVCDFVFSHFSFLSFYSNDAMIFWFTKQKKIFAIFKSVHFDWILMLLSFNYFFFHLSTKILIKIVYRMTSFVARKHKYELRRFDFCELLYTFLLLNVLNWFHK